MISAQRRSLLASIATTIADYRQGEIAPITPTHVDRWVGQFRPLDQPIILMEIDALLKRFYLSRLSVKGYLREFIRSVVLADKTPQQVFPRVRFLRVQAPHSSQDEMLNVVNEILHEDYTIDISSCGTESADKFVYMDDGIFTGNRLRYDLTPGQLGSAWITDEAPKGCTLLVYVLALHRQGNDYVDSYLRSAAALKGIHLEVWYEIEIDNRRQPGGTAECLWPETLLGDSDVDWYLQECQQRIAIHGWNNTLFRPRGTPSKETLFTSPTNRTQVESAFLRVGANLIRAGATHADSIRPLGFEKLESLGFGTPFVTYRNIANNCPLALWWGDPTAPSSHPFSKWYPLFPRRTNNQLGSMMGDVDGLPDSDVEPDDVPF